MPMMCVTTYHPPAGGGGVVTSGLWTYLDTLALSNGTGIASWTDSSGNTRPGVQASSALQAVWQTGQINGYGAAYFAGTDDTHPFYFTLPDLSALTEGEIFLVLKTFADPSTSGGHNGGIMEMGTSGIASLYPYTDNNVYLGWGSTARQTVGDPTPALNAWHILNVVSKAGEWTLRINGTSIYTTASNTVGFASAPRFGADSSATYNFYGWLANLLIYDHALTSGDRSTTLGALQTKFGL